MRPIKFRAWVAYSSNPRMVYFGLFDVDEGWHKSESVELGGCEIMQFTGLHDADGKEIYEGDLIHVVMPAAFIGSQKSDLVRPVKYGYGAFYVDGIDDLSMFNHHRDRLEVFKVIGNIYENPELL